MIQRKFQCMDFDNPKVFGDTSIYDGHVVIFFFLLLVYSIIDCSRSSEGLFLMYSLLLLDCKKAETQREGLSYCWLRDWWTSKSPLDHPRLSLPFFADKSLFKQATTAWSLKSSKGFPIGKIHSHYEYLRSSIEKQLVGLKPTYSYTTFSRPCSILAQTKFLLAPSGALIAIPT